MRIEDLGIFVRVAQMDDGRMAIVEVLRQAGHGGLVDIAQHKAERAGLHLVRGRITFLKFSARPSGEITVAGAIDIHFGAQGLGASFV